MRLHRIKGAAMLLALPRSCIERRSEIWCAGSPRGRRRFEHAGSDRESRRTVFLVVDHIVWPFAHAQANFGILGFDTPYEMIRHVTGDFLQGLSSIPAALKPAVVWRETSPQHFNTSRGDGAFVNRRWAVAYMGRRCVSIATSKLSNVSNAASLPLVRAAGVDVLGGIWRSAAGRPSDHIGWTSRAEGGVADGGKGADSFYLDCTHYCLASGLLDHWVALLVSWLLKKIAAGGL